MNNKNSKLKTSLIIILLGNIILIAGASYLFYELRSTKEDLVDLSKEEEKLKDQINNLAVIEASIEDTKSERQKLDEYFIKTKEETALLLTDVEKIASDLGLEVDVSVGAEQSQFSDEEVPVLNLNMKIDGTFKKIYQFAGLLELMPYKMALKEVQTKQRSGMGDDGSDPRWDATISADIVSYIEE